jgi:L-fucose mutarotase
MLKGISPLFSPELLATLYRMGHGDEIVLADAHFPGHSISGQVIRADGLQIEALLDAILPLFALDGYVDNPVVMMQCVPGDSRDPAIAAGYRKVVDRYAPDTPAISFIERFAFYERAKSAFTVVMTGDTRKYANILLKKGISG